MGRNRQLQKSVHTLWDAASEAVARLSAKLDKLDDAIRERASEAGIEARPMDPETATARIGEAARNARQTADQRKGAAGALENRLRRKGEMQADIQAKLSRMSLYHKVGSELRTSQFIGFLLDESLQDLAMRASTELRRISGEQYSLRASTHNTFEVIDHANGDEARSVVTLSGGETFLASLALALGLAQGIADIAGETAGARLDAMFVDEGFGSLDPESLHDAVEALERLREGDRMGRHHHPHPRLSRAHSRWLPSATSQGRECRRAAMNRSGQARGPAYWTISAPREMTQHIASTPPSLQSSYE